MKIMTESAENPMKKQTDDEVGKTELFLGREVQKKRKQIKGLQRHVFFSLLIIIMLRVIDKEVFHLYLIFHIKRESVLH